MKDEAFLRFMAKKREISYFPKPKDKRLRKVIDKVVHIEREDYPGFIFRPEVHSIVGQQISTKDHSTIWQRMENELGYPLIPTHIARLG